MDPRPEIFSPDYEIVRGVNYGSPDELLTPAYWHWRCIEDDSRAENLFNCAGTLREEVGFCLLGGYGITRELNYVYFRHLKKVGIFSVDKRPKRNRIEQLLSAPISENGKKLRYRYPKQRSKRIAEAMNRFETLNLEECDPKEFRDKLSGLSGVGPKTASWIARNWLKTDAVAIIDIHVLRAGKLIGLFGSDCKLPRDYSFLEQRFIDFSLALGVRASVLDAVMWYDMRTFGSRMANRST